MTAQGKFLRSINLVGLITNWWEHFKRITPISEILKTRTVLLFGPRQTGKSSFVWHQLKDQITKSYNLLDQGLLLRLLADPTLIRKEIEFEKLHDGILLRL